MGISGRFECSIDIKLGEFPDGPSDYDIAKSLLDFFEEKAQFKVVAIQRCPNKIARVTIKEGGEVAKADFEDDRSIHIRGDSVSGDHPRPPVEKVLVYHYPYENDDSQVRKVLSHFGSFEDISYQSWVSLKGVHTGTRIVRMVHTSHFPRSLMIDGFRCKIWYRGQPVTCDVSKEDGHVAAKCPKKDTCFNCHQPGHVSRECPDRSYGRGAWGRSSNRVSAVSEPGGAASGGSQEDLPRREWEYLLHTILETIDRSEMYVRLFFSDFSK